MTGSIATFYSYKGGVGRSFLLANVATLLARWGYRVLCVDWDIEAPGLDEYFRPWLGARERPGLVDLVTRFSAEGQADWRAHVSELRLPGVVRTLDLITAGAPGPDLAARIQAIDWRELYDRRGFGAYVETMRDEWKAAYDLVLVDSRTGITDIGGICTVHLPDILVAVFTANQQSLRGVKDVVQMAEARRSKLPLSRAGLLTLPVPARFDARGQDDLAKDWMRQIACELEHLYDGWLDADISPRQFLDVSRIPYFSVWTFGERLAVLEERDNDPEGISYHFATIAALLARGLEDAGQLCRGRDAYVEVARESRRLVQRGSITPAFEYDYFVSYPPGHVELAREVATGLRSAGSTVFLDADEVHRGGDPRTAIEHAAARCRHFVMLRSSSSTWQLGEYLAFAAAAGVDPSRLIYDVQLSPSLRGLGHSLRDESLDPRQVHKIDATRGPPDRIVDHILPGVARASAEAPIDDELRALADRYSNGRIISELVGRVATQDRFAGEMGAYVRAHHISRDELARANHDGLTVALAEAAKAVPQPGDLARLIEAGLDVQPVDAAYRVLTAVSTILERDRVPEALRGALLRLIDTYLDKAVRSNDAPLAALADTTRRRLKNLT
jgi:MinD-like ATPase involved in chromosome partitioning or flagellar assembly